MGGDTGFNAGFSNPVEVPDIKQIDQWDHQREQAIESLEIADGFVKCQRCQKAIQMIGALTRSAGNDTRIGFLQKRIQYVEYHHSRNIISDNDYNRVIPELRQELDMLLKEEEAKDKLRRLPLYSSRITDFRFVCSASYDKAYFRRNRKKL